MTTRFASPLPNGSGATPFCREEVTLATGTEDRVDRILESLARLDERVQHITTAIDRVPSKHETDDLRRRLESLENDRAKLVWLVLAAVLTAVLSIVVQVRLP